MTSILLQSCWKKITGLKLWNLAKGSTEDADNGFYLYYKAARPTLLAWGLNDLPMNSPSWQKAVLYHAWGLTQYYFDVKVNANRMERNFLDLYSVLRHLNGNKEIEWNTFKIGLN